MIHELIYKKRFCKKQRQIIHKKAIQTDIRRPNNEIEKQKQQKNIQREKGRKGKHKGKKSPWKKVDDIIHEKCFFF